jgi:hypothetical protein
MEDEFAAHQTLEARAAKEREELLLECLVQALDRHKLRKTPTTLPRIWTCFA